MEDIEKNNTGPVREPLTDEEVSRATSELIAKHAIQLSEHITSVQIICTVLKPDGTTNRYAYGKGDLYARAHACTSWLKNLEDHGNL